MSANDDYHLSTSIPFLFHYYLVYDRGLFLFFFFFFETHFILEYKPKAKPSRSYEPLHLRDIWYTKVAPHQSESTSVESVLNKR
jgi:hypothetical protein